MKKEPKDDFNACQDFFTLVVQCHILCAVMDMLNMASLNDVPDIGISCEKFKNKCKADYS